MSPLPSLDALRVFQAAAATGSFSRAAQQLHVTQGAVSHRIRALEEQLGIPLFDRSSRRVVLTAQGQLLARAVDEGLARIQRGLDEVQALQASGQLMVSCSPSFAIRWLVPHLPELRAEHPDLDVRISADDRLVQPGFDGIDVCVRYGPGGTADAEALRLSVERVTPVCSPRLLQGGSPLRQPADLARHVLLHDEVLRGHPGRVGWARWLEAAGAPEVSADRGPRFSHAHLAIEAAIAGQGVALARGILVARDLAEGRLVAPFPLAVESGLAYWVLTPRGAAPRPAVAAFRDWIVAAVAGGGSPPPAR